MRLSFVMLLFPVMLLIIPVLIGVYVYSDARNRNMNAVLWALIAVFAPSLIGFIIYLLVRSSHSNLKCPKCKASVTEQYAVCPNCGTKLKAVCSSCGIPVEQEWKVCPNCAQPLPEYQMDCTPPVRAKDKNLGKILAAIIIVPVLFIIIAVLSFGAYDSSGAASMMSASYTSEEYLEMMENPEVDRWWEECQKKKAYQEGENTAYVLRYYSFLDHEEEKDFNTTCYAIYIPSVGAESNISVDYSGTFKKTMDLRFTSGGKKEAAIHCITSKSDDSLTLKLYRDEKEINYEILDVPFPTEPVESEEER
ncbi:MAG: zinc ribbon domain-containing protein [Lachnospiraceae bacterium]|nr:zinc ribbon domain-containing protein [Lachnospiraceae bacterium]